MDFTLCKSLWPLLFHLILIWIQRQPVLPPSFLSLYWICYNIVSVLVSWLQGIGGHSYRTRDLTPTLRVRRTRDLTPTLRVGRGSLNHWTTREVPAGVTVLNRSFWSDCSPPGSSAHGITQVRILAWVAISYFRGSFQQVLLSIPILQNRKPKIRGVKSLPVFT